MRIAALLSALLLSACASRSQASLTHADVAKIKGMREVQACFAPQGAYMMVAKILSHNCRSEPRKSFSQPVPVAKNSIPCGTGIHRETLPDKTRLTMILMANDQGLSGVATFQSVEKGCAVSYKLVFVRME
jgi:hypothetical protein